MTPSGAYRHAHVAQGPFFNPKDAMRHNLDISGAWTTFLLDKSEGFTRKGVERLNDSIRTYVWAILAAQAQARSNILRTGTGFDAQKQFLTNIEDAIVSPVTSLVASLAIRKHCSMHSHPWTSCLELGDMALHPGNIQGYNNRGPDSRIGCGYWTQPWDKRGRADRLERR